jgi:hypothetical protein
MATAAIVELKGKSDAAWANLKRQLAGMEPYAERADAPGEWTTREVLSHLLFEEGWAPVALLESFSDRNLPVIDIKSSDTNMTPERERMSLDALAAALDAQRRAVFGYLEGLGETDLGRKARIPLFQQFMGTDEIPLPLFIGAMFDYHWNDHAGQIAKIRKAVGLPEAA